MPLSEEQFKKLTEILDMRELIIRIDENTKNSQASFLDHAAKDVAEFALVKRSAEKLHERMDVFKEDVRDDMAKATGFQNRLIGAFGLATVGIPIIIAVFFKH